MNKLVLTWLVCLLALSLSSVGVKPVNATTLYGATTEYEYQKVKDKDKKDKEEREDKHKWEHEDEWKHKDKDKDGAPVPFESSPAVGALLLVSWGVWSTVKRRQKVVV